MKTIKTFVMAATAALALVAVSGSNASAQYPPYPTYPVQQTYPQVIGYNPYTGGLDTGGTTIYNSAHDPWRQASLYNGSATTVNRPVFDGSGNVTGWVNGTQWVNSVNGQIHFQGQVQTPNGLGGMNTQQVSRFAGASRQGWPVPRSR